MNDYTKIVKLIVMTTKSLTELHEVINHAKIEPTREQALYLQERLRYLTEAMEAFSK